MDMSNRTGNILGFLLIIIALIIQGWLSIFQLATDDFTVTSPNMIFYNVNNILFITGSVLIATLNINRIFAIYHRINYVVAMIGLVGLSILLVFRGYLESFLFPRTMIIYILIIDLFWIMLLGLLLGRFKTQLNKGTTTN